MGVGKWSNDGVMDAALSYVKTNGKKMYVCTTAISSASVPNYTKITVSAALTGAISMASLASVSLAAGDTSGRKLTVPQAASVAVTASGTAARICLVNSAGSGTVTYITTCTSQSLTSGNTVTIPSFDIEVRDPS
jgi:hypothetical protein